VSVQQKEKKHEQSYRDPERRFDRLPTSRERNNSSAFQPFRRTAPYDVVTSNCDVEICLDNGGHKRPPLLVAAYEGITKTST
jgi:hypothetical protein